MSKPAKNMCFFWKVVWLSTNKKIGFSLSYYNPHLKQFILTLGPPIHKAHKGIKTRSTQNITSTFAMLSLAGMLKHHYEMNLSALLIVDWRIDSVEIKGQGTWLWNCAKGPFNSYEGHSIMENLCGHLGGGGWTQFRGLEPCELTRNKLWQDPLM